MPAPCFSASCPLLVERELHVGSGSWPCRNPGVLRARRRISEKFRVMKFTYSAQIRLDTVLENCIFYIPSMYEFLHSQGHTRKNSERAKGVCLSSLKRT